MIDLNKYLQSSDDVSFVENLRHEIVDCQCYVALEYSRNNFGFGFLIEPMGDAIEVWQYGEIIASYATFDDFLLNFIIEGKPFIQCVPDIEYSQD